jgi:hypothetical protein
VPWRQGEILKQMCMEINGVVITHFDALHSAWWGKRPPEGCLHGRGRSLLWMEGKVGGAPCEAGALNARERVAQPVS